MKEMVEQLQPHHARLRAAVDSMLSEAVISGKFLGLSFAVVNSAGKFIYAGAGGSQDFGQTTPMSLETPCFMASATKLMTSVAAMQVVERGLVGLDDDLGLLLPELDDREILVSFDDKTNETIYKKPSNKITLRQLLSHSSGFVYDSTPNTTVGAWAVSQGKAWDLFTTEWTAFDRPLEFNPGTSWSYSPGIDWAGRIVEKVTGLSLEEYMQTNIWSVVGMRNTTFRPGNRDKTYRILEMGTRAGGPYDGLTPDKGPWPIPAKNDLGGGGIFSTVDDYAKMLSALLSDTGALLNRESLEEFFKPQLAEQSQHDLQELQKKGSIQTDIPRDLAVDHALGGLLVQGDIPNRRKRGSMCWDGMANSNWMIDQKSGIACVFLTQILPAQDRATKELWSRLEAAVYQHVS